MGYEEVEKKHFYSTFDFWIDQAFGRLEDEKRFWPRFSEISGLPNHCAFCEYFACEEGKCPLKFTGKACGDNNYQIWADSFKETEENRSIAAWKIFCLIRPWMKNNYPEYFKESKTYLKYKKAGYINVR